jgi:hypothetical protein
LTNQSQKQGKGAKADPLTGRAACIKVSVQHILLPSTAETVHGTMVFLFSLHLRNHHILGRRWPPFTRRRIPPHSLSPVRWATTSSDSSSGPVYERLQDVERLEYYRPGGYHPIEIGNCLHERYRTVHKLGHRTFSTIWLARDEQASKYVAVKVCTADAIEQEGDTLSRLEEIAL